MNTTRKTTETPDQWAGRMHSNSCMCYNLGTASPVAELSRVKAKADACDLWRAEAIAAQEALGDQPEGCWEKLAEARAARLAKGLT